MDKDQVLVVGGGWSGISCAVELIAQGKQVSLIETSRQLGGKARSVVINDLKIDNGQHIMLGAYHHVLRLLKLLSIPEQTVLQRQPLEMHLLSNHNKAYHLLPPGLPAPFHLLTGLLLFKGITIAERFQALSMAFRLALCGYQLQADISVIKLLQQHRQSEQLIQVLWEPLCLAALNTPVAYASAQVFLNVLKTSFSHLRHDSDLLLFKQDLTSFLAHPAENYIQQHNGKILFNTRIRQLIIENDHIAGVKTQNGSLYADQVVLATPFEVTSRFLHGINSQQLKDIDFKYEPICTIYLRYPKAIKLPRLLTGLVGTLSQWVFDCSLNHQPGLVAVVISGPGNHMNLDRNKLALLIHDELNQLLGPLPLPIEYHIIRVKKATFSCCIGIQDRRPPNNTDIKGLYLAGDYTKTAYPATLEGAVISGFNAATAVLNTIKY